VPLSFALTHNDVRLRLVRMKDSKNMEQLILSNREWLRPWEATNPEGPNSFDIRGQIRTLLKAMDNNTCLPFVIEESGVMVGQLNVANILFGSVSSCVIGYWVAPEAAGRQIMPTAVALVSDYLFKTVGIHRIEIDIRPENVASLRVVEKLGFRYEGLKQRFIHINGAWRDHYVFALTSEEVESGVLNRWLRKQVGPMNYPFSTKVIKHTEQNDEHFGS
jgi:ribosomal-protein-alanine N-acetyltransferase